MKICTPKTLNLKVSIPPPPKKKMYGEESVQNGMFRWTNRIFSFLSSIFIEKKKKPWVCISRVTMVQMLQQWPQKSGAEKIWRPDSFCAVWQWQHGIFLSLHGTVKKFPITAVQNIHILYVLDFYYHHCFCHCHATSVESHLYRSSHHKSILYKM